MPGPSSVAPGGPGPIAAVCFDVTSAATVIGAGGMVVLCGSDGGALAAGAVSLRPDGRISVLVGDPADEEVQAAACAMARELFGREPVVVPSATDSGAVGCGSVGRPPQVAGPTDP